jgi:hypothetical protein
LCRLDLEGSCGSSPVVEDEGAPGVDPRYSEAERRKGEVMGAPYGAVLHGNHLEWRDQEPEELLSDHEVEVFVTILDTSESPATTRSRGAAMAAALE